MRGQLQWLSALLHFYFHYALWIPICASADCSPALLYLHFLCHSSPSFPIKVIQHILSSAIVAQGVPWPLWAALCITLTVYFQTLYPSFLVISLAWSPFHPALPFPSGCRSHSRLLVLLIPLSDSCWCLLITVTLMWTGWTFSCTTLQMWLIKVEGGAGVRTVTGFCIRLLRSPDKLMSAMSPQGGHKCIMVLRSTRSWQAQGGLWYTVDINWDKVIIMINNLQRSLHCHNDTLRSPT